MAKVFIGLKNSLRNLTNFVHQKTPQHSNTMMIMSDDLSKNSKNKDS